MSATHDASQQSQPSRRALRMWAGLLVAVWLLIQMAAVMFSYVQSASFREREYSNHRYHANDFDPAAIRAGYWHSSTVALGTAALATVFIVGGVGLVLGTPWAWRILLAGSVLQILFTIATQLWQATLSGDLHEGPLAGGSLGIIGAVIGILLWNVIPVGILFLSVSARPTDP
ncbi:MAG: hypothetical protein NTY65_11405 [Planctomycetota bacterium]|nr:hypothetical protein [Planctomycetota bacterium]